MKIKSKKRITKLKDIEWKKKIKERDGIACAICKKENHKNHVHHVAPRHIPDLRYDLMNGIVLCFFHHKIGPWAAHQNAIYFSEWLKENKKEQYDYLLEKIKTLQPK